MSDNLNIYNQVRIVPQEAQKSIGGGRLKGMTDINPMWRIKCLTECFGPCGFGWYYDILEKWIEQSGVANELTANVQIALYIKMDGEWSKPIIGIGGSSFVTKEKSGVYVSDECFKMALTDAISVACKALGIGADVYWNKDRTKYDAQADKDKKAQVDYKANLTNLTKELERTGIDVKVVLDAYKVKTLEDVSKNTELYNSVMKKFKATPDKKVE